MTHSADLSGPVWPLPLATTPFPNETLRSYVARLALLNRLPPERVLRRFYTAESPMDNARLLAIRTGQTPHLLMRQLPELATPGPWPHDQHENLARSWACHPCVAARTGRDDWKVEIWVISGHHHLCVKHRRWTRTHHGHYMGNFAGAVDGQFNLNRAPEIIHAQRRLHRLFRRRTPRRVLTAYQQCVDFWRELAKHGYAVNRTERLLDLIAPDEPIAHRSYAKREAALLPDLVEMLGLYTSPVWRHRALGSPRDVQLFHREFERRLPPERQLRTTAIPWFRREATLVAERINERMDEQERQLMRVASAASGTPEWWPPLIMRRLLRHTPSYGR